MANYTGPLCRLCRREGIKLFLKGAKCFMEKCPVSKRQYPPGQHGKSRIKLSDYAIQLREKQKAKRIYGLLERQFRFYFKRAEKSRSATGEKLLEFLERRLDNTIFRLSFALTRADARQVVAHGHVYVNNRKVDRPSFLVKTGDRIEIKCSDKQKQKIKDIIEQSKDKTIPPWLKVDSANLKAEVAGTPTKKDVGFPINEQLIVELYSK